MAIPGNLDTEYGEPRFSFRIVRAPSVPASRSGNHSLSCAEPFARIWTGPFPRRARLLAGSKDRHRTTALFRFRRSARARILTPCVHTASTPIGNHMAPDLLHLFYGGPIY